mmetsp:Transcript_47440/g.87177  ORF Transcript_47440/g.87177 Transcript_47440/m.87177 type:complete len:216 (+) Transcript_47440:309-956(+)
MVPWAHVKVLQWMLTVSEAHESWHHQLDWCLHDGHHALLGAAPSPFCQQPLVFCGHQQPHQWHDQLLPTLPALSSSAWQERGSSSASGTSYPLLLHHLCLRELSILGGNPRPGLLVLRGSSPHTCVASHDHALVAPQALGALRAKKPCWRHFSCASMCWDSWGPQLHSMMRKLAGHLKACHWHLQPESLHPGESRNPSATSQARSTIASFPMLLD